MMTKFLNENGGLRTQPRLRKQAGFIQAIIVVIGALVLLRYAYNIDVVGFLTQGKPKELLDQFYGLAVKIWTKYSDTIIKVCNYIIEFVKNLIARFK